VSTNISKMSKGQLRMFLRRFLLEETPPGSILSYTKLNNNNGSPETVEAPASYTTISARHMVSFRAPFTGNVEINFKGFYACNETTDHRGALRLGLSDAASFNSLGNKYKKTVWNADDEDDVIVDFSWVLTGLSPGTVYNYWIGHMADNAGDYFHAYGGASTNQSPDCIIRAISLPSTILTDIT